MKTRNLIFALMLVLLLTVAVSGSAAAGKPPPPTPSLTFGSYNWSMANYAMTISVSDIAWSGVKPADIAFAVESTGPYGSFSNYVSMTRARGITSLSYLETPAMNVINNAAGYFEVYLVLLDGKGNELARTFVISFSGSYLS